MPYLMSVLKKLTQGAIADKRIGVFGLVPSDRFLKQMVGARFRVRRTTLYLALPYGVPPSVLLFSQFVQECLPS